MTAASVYKDRADRWILVLNDHPVVRHVRLGTSPCATEAEAIQDALKLVRGETAEPKPNSGADLVDLIAHRIAKAAS